MDRYFRVYVLPLLLLFCFHLQVNGVKLAAYISQNGLHGEIHFSQNANGLVQIESSLETTLQHPDQIWSWSVHQLPVDYTEANGNRRCSASTLGKQLINFDESLGYLILPGNESSTWNAQIDLTGKNGIYGKSLVLSNPEKGFRICATIVTVEESIDHIAEARFHAPIAGSMYFRWLAAKETNHRDTLIYANLFHVRNVTEETPLTQHRWKIFVTDIFDTNTEKSEMNCNVLQLIFDPQNLGSGKSIGDIDTRVGPLKVARNVQRQEFRDLFHDDDLVLLPSDLTGPHRQLFVVIYDHIHTGNFLACAKIRNIRPRVAKTIFNEKGVKGEVTLHQRSRFEPTWLNFTVHSANNELKENTEFLRDLAGFHIRQLPPDPVRANEPDHCVSCETIYNPSNVDESNLPPPGFGTQDQYPVGDLSGKLEMRNQKYPHNYLLPLTPGKELNGIYWDTFLPLEGVNSVVHRSMTIERHNHNNGTQSIWTCGTVTLYQDNRRYQLPMITAQVLFRYPLVGRILFRQPRDDPTQDTTIIVEYLIHADGSTLNSSESHRWAIHHDAPGRDFYNWSGRCLSTHQVYNPYKVSFDMKEPQKTCSSDHGGTCRLGDIGNRFGTLSIAGKKLHRSITRAVYTDRFLPLSGHNNIFGKSLVIYGDNGPTARGERLACSIIGGHFHRKVVARDWYANGVPLTVKGKLEMLQQSEYELTNVEVNLKGLLANSGYHVHVAPVQGDLEFPCEATTLYDHWNPRKVNAKKSPPPKIGSSDAYEMGDLSGKFGTLDHLTEYMDAYNDTNLPLFGYESILGRSIVIHKKEKNVRWACSTLERGYSPSEAREIRAIASFHHPKGYAFGYMRFTQLIHKDGSRSDTVIEVNLRHPGYNDRNMTRNHHWKIFVNPIGVDAVVEQTAVRCVAGGYVWNPFYTQLADPLNNDLYREECGPDNPLRCYVGDVSSRIGVIDIGNRRTVFSDQNFPLEGDQSALGRSIVIFGPNYSGERFACANIEPDHDIIKYVNLQKPPKFVVAQFLEDVRHVMGLPEWMLSVDSRKITTLHNGACVQMLMHFKGPLAHSMELDLSRLIASGRLETPTLNIVGYANPKRKKVLAYRSCGVRDPNEKNKKYRYRLIGSSSSAITKASVIVTMAHFAVVLLSYKYSV